LPESESPPGSIGSPVVTVLASEVRAGLEQAFLHLIGDFHAIVKRKGYGSIQLLRDAHASRLFYEVCTWRSAEAAERCRRDPEVSALVARLDETRQPLPLFGGTRLVSLSSGDGWLDDRRAYIDRRSGERRTGRAQRLPAERRLGEERRTGAERRLTPRSGSEAQLRDAGTPVDLLRPARMARAHSQASISRFRVGAALQTTDGQVITGCNIENVTLGLTMCAERVALFKALSEGHRAFSRIAVVADAAEPTPPCGSCRQLLWEFGGNLEVLLGNLQGQRATLQLEDLLPLPFDRRFLDSRGAGDEDTSD
jgi:cytidine deaminase